MNSVCSPQTWQWAVILLIVLRLQPDLPIEKMEQSKFSIAVRQESGRKKKILPSSFVVALFIFLKIHLKVCLGCKQAVSEKLSGRHSLLVEVR